MKRHSCWFGWCVLAGVVIAADVYGDETMSSTFRKLARHPIAGPALYGAWLGLTAHLFLPTEHDPLRYYSRRRACTPTCTNVSF